MYVVVGFALCEDALLGAHPDAYLGSMGGVHEEENDESALGERDATGPNEQGATLNGDDTKSEEAPATNIGPTHASWPSRYQELLIASAGAVGATISAAFLAGSGSDVETLEWLAVSFCGFAALSTWFLPLPRENPRMTRVGSWAAAFVILYWMGPIRVAEGRAAHDLSQGTRTEKEAALSRLVRLGKRDLAGADLRELNLSDADLTNLSLRGANLSHSTLERALLLESDLSSADLSGASLRGANLRAATLTGAKLGTGADTARCDRFTQLPASFECRHGTIFETPASAPASK